jgi:hypothetical protein
MLAHSTTIVYQPPDHGLCITAKRYWIPEALETAADPDALTAILLHSTSFHKETWEPSLERFLTLSTQPGSKVRIREAWAVDCPNHGEAAFLNEPKLNLPEFRNNCVCQLFSTEQRCTHTYVDALPVTCEKYAHAVHRFLNAIHRDERGTSVDFRTRKLLGIGHSLGGNAM